MTVPYEMCLLLSLGVFLELPLSFMTPLVRQILYTECETNKQTNKSVFLNDSFKVTNELYKK